MKIKSESHYDEVVFLCFSLDWIKYKYRVRQLFTNNDWKETEETYKKLIRNTNTKILQSRQWIKWFVLLLSFTHNNSQGIFIWTFITRNDLHFIPSTKTDEIPYNVQRVFYPTTLTQQIWFHKHADTFIIIFIQQGWIFIIEFGSFNFKYFLLTQ